LAGGPGAGDDRSQHEQENCAGAQHRGPHFHGAAFETLRDVDQGNGRRQDHGGNGVDLRRDPALQPRINFQRQGRRANSRHKGSDQVIVKRGGKNQQGRREDSRRCNGEGDTEKRGPFVRPQVERGLFNRAVHARQTRSHHNDHVRNAKGDMSNDDGGEAQLHAQQAQEDDNRHRHDDFGNDERKVDDSIQDGLGAPAKAREDQRPHGPEHHAHQGGSGGHQEAVQHRLDDLLVAPE
jgi:hypothetical protein